MLVATKDGALVGHAVICPLFPAGNLDTAWFLKDIFVASAARGEGIGEALIKACAKETLRRKGARFDLTVDAGNEGARTLYERLGADRHAQSLSALGRRRTGLAGRARGLGL
jgi:ribosomal protein S18 acetylase RimI-like enzyme